MRYTITKTGNYGNITPPPTGILAATLDKYLQYTRQGAQYMPNPAWAIVKFYKPKIGRFPWGLLSIVKAIMNKYCTVKGDEYIIEKINQATLESNNLRDATLTILREYQKDAIMALVRNRGGILVMPCGSGKTLTLIEYFKLMNLKTLVIVPTVDIRKQWADYNLDNVTVSTYQNPKLGIKGIMEQYQIVCFDEAHHTSAKTLYALAMKTSTNTILIGCSATIERDDGEDMRINAALGKIVYSIDRKELIRQGFLANAIVKYLKPTFQTDGRYMDYPKVYNLEIVHNENRNQLIIDTALKETRNYRNILILVSTIEHGEILREGINAIIRKEANVEGWPTIIFMNGQSKNRDQDMSVYDIIIATSIYDEGYNLPSLDTLILAGSGKSTIKLIQRIGRVLRPKADSRMAHIYDFMDKPKYLRQQYLTRRSLLEQEFEVQELTEQTRLI